MGHVPVLVRRVVAILARAVARRARSAASTPSVSLAAITLANKSRMMA
jgi:hypothetical protein